MNKIKYILITGCSSGIGYNTAVKLHQRGWRVIATCKKKKDCHKLKQILPARMSYAPRVRYSSLLRIKSLTLCNKTH